MIAPAALATAGASLWVGWRAARVGATRGDRNMKTRTIVRTIKDPKALGLYTMPRDEHEYDAAVAELNKLLDEVGDATNDPRYRLIETLSALIEAYDDEHYEVPDVSGAEMLRYLMEEHNLKQADLAEELGAQSVVSEVLSGTRELNLGQICRLAKRFHVTPAAFLPRTGIRD
jgi:HTH-type transcriptional regulator/antitoxin HigA